MKQRLAWWVRIIAGLCLFTSAVKVSPILWRAISFNLADLTSIALLAVWLLMVTCALLMLVMPLWARSLLILLFVANFTTGYSFVPWSAQALSNLIAPPGLFWAIMTLNLGFVIAAFWAAHQSARRARASP